MIGPKSKTLRRLRRMQTFLLVLAVLLTVLTAVSGWFYFERGWHAPSPAATEATTPSQETVPEQTVSPTLPQDTAVTEPLTVPAEIPQTQPEIEDTLPENTQVPEEDYLVSPPTREEEKRFRQDGLPPEQNATTPPNQETMLPPAAASADDSQIPADISAVAMRDEGVPSAGTVSTSLGDLPSQTHQLLSPDIPAGVRTPTPVKSTPLPDDASTLWLCLFVAGALLLVVDLLFLFLVTLQIRKLTKLGDSICACANANQSTPRNLHPTVGRTHDIGKRSYQQDSFGVIPILNDQGLLAVVADGMGGLSSGEKVSQRIVMKALDFGAGLKREQISTALTEMVQAINDDVNRMLGPEGLYKSGSTLVSMLTYQNKLWWVSIGDSRIYLYRDGFYNQLSRDHDLLQEWIPEIQKGNLSYEEAAARPEARKLTSFIGMGKLRYVDQNTTALTLLPDDRILLMSDGVYGTLSDAQITSILRDYPDVQQAADAIGREIARADLRFQDNYTVLVIGL